MLDQPIAAGILEQMYKVFLNRFPDDAGFKSHLATLHKGPFPDAFGKLLQAFTQSPEAELIWRRKFLAKELRLIYELYQENLAGAEFISLGSHCYTSWILKIEGLKKSSGPFDWLFSNATMVSAVLDDDFHSLLDKKHYRPVPREQREFQQANKCDHELYKSKFGIQYIFNHRDPSEPDDYEYLKRCVERFRAQAETQQKKIVIHTARAYPETKEAFADLSSSVKKYSPNALLLFVAINDAKQTVPSVQTLHRDDESTLLEYKARSEWSDLQFGDMSDDLNLFHIAMSHSVKLIGKLA